MCFMNKKIRNIIALMLAVITIFTVSSPAVSAASVKVADVGALWDSFTAGSGTFTVTSSSRVFVVADSEPSGVLLQTAELLQRQLQADFEGCFTDLVWGKASWAKTGDIVLNLDSSSGTGADGYKLNVTSTTATVTAADTDGLIYGTNNLMKCFRAVGGNSISGFTGYDTPDTKERTVHLDLARKYYTVEWVKNFIKQMSWMGYNALELHLSEDGGFRADFWDEDYYTDNYDPENDFSWLCGSYVQSWVYDETLPDGTTGTYTDDPDAGKYLTTAELVEICEVAKEYHIEIIPSFDSPAHMDYITWKFEQNYKSNMSYSFTYDGTTYKASSTSGCINYTGRTGRPSPTWPHYTTIDITDGTMAKAFVFALYEDMADFFKEYAGSTKFNIGADEVNLTSSASSWPRKWSYSAFPGYINDLNRMLNEKDYTVRAYNDFIGSTTYNQSNSAAVYKFDDNIEICYWTSDFQPTTGTWSEATWHCKFFWENNTGTTDNWGDGGRTMYNCIQTNSYYVLRIGTSGDNRDARDPDNRNWTFYHTNAEAIFNEWYPADMSEKGVYAENAADVPEDQLGGAYFLIWNDYAALNTESEVWNGAVDGWDKDRTYYLFDIMAANIMKMWNSDINKSTVTYSYKQSGNVSSVTYNGTVTYDEFAEVSSKFGWFPGFTSCSKAASLPAADTMSQAYLADHSALTEALKNKISNADGTYTAESYADYEEAYEAAETVNANHAATEAEVAKALANLNAAAEALVVYVAVDKSALQTAYAAYESKNEDDYTSSSWSTYVTAAESAKEVIEDEGATQEDVNDALADLKNAEAALVNIAELNTAVSNAITEQGSYTEDTWAAYTTALDAAKEVLANGNATQTEVNKALDNLTSARNALKENIAENTSVLSVRKISASTPVGKKVGLVINTTTDVETLELYLNGTEVDLTLCINNVQTLNGEEVRVWMINFKATAKGEYTYVIKADGKAAAEVNITVK